LGLKDQACLYRTCFFARPVPKKPSQPLFFSITGCGKRRQDVLPAALSSIFHTSGLSSLLESEIRAGKLLVDPQEELVGGRPNHGYIKACPRRPRVDRVLQKTHILLVRSLSVSFFIEKELCKQLRM
jgi:hypothetical protein